MANVLLRFGSYSFNQDILSWSTRTDILVDAASIPKRDGQIITGGKVAVREYELRGQLVADTPTDLRTLRDTMMQSLVNRLDNLYLFDDRYIEAQMVSFGDSYVEGTALTALDFIIVFQSTLPYELSETLQSETLITTTSGNQILQVTNAGNYTAYAKITVTAPSSPAISNDCTITNQTTDEEFEYVGTIAVDTSLVVDGTVVPFTVTNDGTSDIANYSGDVIELSPGTNNIQINAVVGATLKVEWRDTYV